MYTEIILKVSKSFQRRVDTITEKKMAVILSKFTVLCLSSHFLVYLFKLKLILIYNRVLYHYTRVFLILLPHPIYIYIYIPRRMTSWFRNVNKKRQHRSYSKFNIITTEHNFCYFHLLSSALCFQAYIIQAIALPPAVRPWPPLHWSTTTLAITSNIPPISWK